MATPLKSANTIDFQQARDNVGRRMRSEEETLALKELRLQLVTRLQTTLDLASLLQLFMQELGSHIRVDGLRYRNEQYQLEPLLGRNTSHSCGYRLVTRQDNLGEIIFFRSRRFSEQELSTLEFLLGTLICPLRNALQYHQALNASLTDPLTGAGNRISLNDTLDREIALARRHTRPLSTLMVDIDKFKAINDTHGHSAGDKVLTQLVTLISDIHRNTDVCFRYGGEEFVVLLGETDLAGAEVIAERLRQGIDSTRILYEKTRLAITVSIGAAEFCETDYRESLLKRADKALYRAKSNGGNQVICL